MSSHKLTSGYFCLLGWMLLIAGSLLGEQPHDTAADSNSTAKRSTRLREGASLIDQLGEFREAGGRVVFYPQGTSTSLQLLENLALERVASDLDQPGRIWSVTGTITEYRGGNFLLLQRVVLKSRSNEKHGPPSS